MPVCLPWPHSLAWALPTKEVSPCPFPHKSSPPSTAKHPLPCIPSLSWSLKHNVPSNLRCMFYGHPAISPLKQELYFVPFWAWTSPARMGMSAHLGDFQHPSQLGFFALYRFSWMVWLHLFITASTKGWRGRDERETQLPVTPNTKHQLLTLPRSLFGQSELFVYFLPWFLYLKSQRRNFHPVCVCVCRCLCVCLHMCMSVCSLKYMSACVHECVCVCIYIYLWNVF